MNIIQSQFLLLGVSALVLTGFLTWPIRLFAIRFGALDMPNLERKSQIAPVPYLGGVIIALGISLITLSATFVGTEKFAGENGKQKTDLLLTILVSAILLGLMGRFDDLRSLSPCCSQYAHISLILEHTRRAIRYFCRLCQSFHSATPL